jgi:hypothetical protein
MIDIESPQERRTINKNEYNNTNNNAPLTNIAVMATQNYPPPPSKKNTKRVKNENGKPANNK